MDEFAFVNILEPDSQYGDINVLGEFITIGTNRRAKTPEQFQRWNYFDVLPNLPDASTGSFAAWEVPNGDYVVKGQLFSKELSSSGDSFGYYDAGVYTELYTVDDLIEYPGIGNMLDVEFTVTVTNGELNLSVWDTEDNRGTSMLRIDSITGVQQEEPEPIPQPTPELMPDNLIFGSELMVISENEFFLQASLSSDFIAQWYIETSESIFPATQTNLQLDFFNGEWFNSSGDSFFVSTDFISGQNY